MRNKSKNSLVSGLDVIDLGITWDRLVAISDEIVSTLMRTSFSTIVSESYDLTVAILDRRGLLVAQGTKSLPVFMGTAPKTLQHFLRRYPAESLKPGDIVISNDPWVGTGHMFDINVMRPVFIENSIVAYTMSITHLPDIGGIGFGATATEIFHEGLRIPITKLYEQEKCNELIIDFIVNNVRTPEQVLGDLFANVTANKVGGQMILEFLKEYEMANLDELSDAICSTSENAMREVIMEMKDGLYQNSFQIEGVEESLSLSCQASINGSSISVSFNGTDPCVRQGINVPFCYTNAMTLYSIKCLTIPTLPNNAGAFMPIDVKAPSGCLLSAEHPSPTGGRHIIGHFVTPLIFGALASAVPESVQAETGMMNLMTFQGTHPNGRNISELFFASGGFGALHNCDGLNTIPGPSNMAGVPIEVWEANTGTTIERKQFRCDSGGPGESRGGLGQELSIRNDTGYVLTAFSMANRTEYPARGFFGGLAGSPREHRINGEKVHPKGKYELLPGDRLELFEAGGGGFGKPHKRSRSSVHKDLEDGFISSEASDRKYTLISN